MAGKRTARSRTGAILALYRAMEFRKFTLFILLLAEVSVSSEGEEYNYVT